MFGSARGAFQKCVICKRSFKTGIEHACPVLEEIKMNEHLAMMFEGIWKYRHSNEAKFIEWLIENKRL